MDLDAPNNPRPDALFPASLDLADALRQLFYRSGGLVVLRGLVDLSPEQLVELSRLLGEVEGDATIGGKVTNGKKTSPVALADGAVIRVRRHGNTISTEQATCGATTTAPTPVLQG